MKKAAYLLCLALFMVTGGSYAQSDYPNRAIRLVVGYSPGGGTDIVARLFGKKASEELGQSIVIENKPGGSGIIAANQVVRSEPDGYTLMMGVTSLNTIQPHIQKNFPYDPLTDLVPVTMTGLVPHLIAVHPSVPARTLPELIEYLKKNPGKINYPSAGNGTTPHIAGELFQKMAGVELAHIPYKSSGQALPDLIAGRLTIAFDTYPAIAPAIRSNQLVPIAVAGNERLPEFPDLPTATEAGLDGYTFSTWYGVFAPKGTSEDVVNKLAKAFNSAFEAPEVKKQLTDMGVTDAMTATPQEFAELVKDELKRYATVVEDAGLREE